MVAALGLYFVAALVAGPLDWRFNTTHFPNVYHQAAHGTAVPAELDSYLRPTRAGLGNQRRFRAWPAGRRARKSHLSVATQCVARARIKGVCGGPGSGQGWVALAAPAWICHLGLTIGPGETMKCHQHWPTCRATEGQSEVSEP